MASHGTMPLRRAPGSDHPRAPLRLELSPSPGKAPLDGGWWPQSRDLDCELADLVDHFPAEVGRVQRALYSRPDWDEQPQTVQVARGRLKTGSFPSDDTQVLVLRMSTRTDVRLLVVPPDHPVGHQAMLLAADPTNRCSTKQILAAGSFDEEAGADGEHWTDAEVSWWFPSVTRGSTPD